MDYAHVLDEVERRLGLGTPEDAQRAVASTVETLGEQLLPLDASNLGADLPRELAEPLLRRNRPGDFDLEELYRRVAERAGVSLGFGREHALVVCQVLAENLGSDLLARVRSRLPDPVAALLEPNPEEREGAVSREVPARLRTLATGRPGSEHPLSEAHADRAQSQSVARAENPHGETKLSSASGISTERQARTIATGKPGPEHPLSDAD